MIKATVYLKRIVLVGILAAMAAPASAAMSPEMFLHDDNSDVTVDPFAGMTSWTVDGTDQLHRQWFWYRIGIEEEKPITLLDVNVIKESDTDNDGDSDVAYVEYGGTDFDVSVRVALDGGPAGSRMSDVAEQVTVINTSQTESLDFHFYQYADFDLGGTAAGDKVVHLGNGAQGSYTFDGEQVGDGWTLRVSEVATEPMAHCEANDENTLKTLLNDTDYTRDLNDDEQAGPGDVAWAYQWDFVLGPDEAFMLSKDKMITPEPATLALMGGGAVLVLFLRRRR